jgi:YYY domain-containing protein
LSIFLWWLSVSLIGWASQPFCFWIFKRLPQFGAAFSRAVSLLAVSYLLWIGASLHLIRNNLSGIFISLLVLLAASAWLALRPGGSLVEIQAFLRREWRWVLVSELLFLLAFLAWTALRAYAVDRIQPAGGEKFMEIAFLNAILRSPSFPPLDPWLSGSTISYYYFGYVVLAFLTRLSATPASLAFDLGDALFFALTVQAAFGLLGEMVALGKASLKGKILSGLAGSLLVAGIGNLEGIVEALYARGWLPASLNRWLALPEFPTSSAATSSFYPGHAAWWWWRASRVIADLDFNGKLISAYPITEFPFFSFLLGDNHPHLLALPFSFLAAALGLDWLTTQERISLPRLLFSAWILGALIFLNTWDFPVYFGLILLSYLVGQASRVGDLRAIPWRETVIRAFGLLAGGIFFYLPFLLSFSSQAGGLLPYVFPPTRLSQYLLMFGPFIFILSIFLPFSLRGSQPLRQIWRITWRLSLGLALFFLLLLGIALFILVLDQRGGGLAYQNMQSWLGGGSLLQSIQRILLARLGNPWLILLLTFLISSALAGLLPSKDPAAQPSHFDPGSLFARVLALTALLLTLSVEFFYLRDSFGVRMNTVFKFYFQGWVLLGCTCAYAIWWMARQAPSLPKTLFAWGAACLVLAGLVYPFMAIFARTAEFSQPPHLDAAAPFQRQYPDEWAGISWLSSQPVASQPLVILEAPCPAYCQGGRVSAFTGFPTLLGWQNHELQWRGAKLDLSPRLADIRSIYTSPDETATLALLDKWHIRYVIFGSNEQSYIQTECQSIGDDCSIVLMRAKFKKILQSVFQQGAFTIYSRE